MVERSGFENWSGYFVVFFGKTLSSHSASPPPGVYMGTNKLSEKLNEMLGVDFAMDWHPI